MNASTFYGPRKAREKTMACDIPSGSEDSDLSDLDDDYPPDIQITASAACGEDHSDTESEDCDSDSDTAPNVTTKRNESKVCRPIWKHKDMTVNDVASEFRGSSYVPTSILALEMPYDFLRHILTPDLISTMTEQTRLYSTQSRPHKPLSVTEGEMEKFFGSLLWMSLIRLPSSRMYWNPKFYVRQVASLMPVNKWEELKSFLHFADNTTAVPKGQDGYDRQHKIRTLADDH
ncbi:hypothetical protein HPB50_000107 [Hyalomma asiaticum]|uniref:Uncharacterized protein n=1 Tax=Hyalomma asiaticum TaxID=266040 RepID=A0ACB7SRV7_HYAAI|nr:hypothetical protein HPB50_000107 [Hyalomma asiaticum]